MGTKDDHGPDTQGLLPVLLLRHLFAMVMTHEHKNTAVFSMFTLTRWFTSSLPLELLQFRTSLFLINHVRVQSPPRIDRPRWPVGGACKYAMQRSAVLVQPQQATARSGTVGLDHWTTRKAAACLRPLESGPLVHSTYGSVRRRPAVFPLPHPLLVLSPHPSVCLARLADRHH
jgi:hypothetical protein